MKKAIIKVALASPLSQTFDYLPPENAGPILPGMRVQVPFGKRKMVGLVIALADHSDLDLAKLKSISNVLDSSPLVSEPVLQLLQRASDYYHHPLGEVALRTLPKFLREGKIISLNNHFLQLTELGQKTRPEELKRAMKQRELLAVLQKEPQSIVQIKRQKFSQLHIDGLISKNLASLIENLAQEKKPAPAPSFELNSAQKNAIETINNQNGFSVFLLKGVTGSGKTEVYLQVIAKTIQQQKQALILVPEIALTPQTVARFQERFPNENIVIMHSAIADSNRAEGWMSAALNKASIIIGTRSAIFVSVAKLGVLILDEEHDNSFKQQTGFRYSARDLAVLRGQLENVPVILGSATPSLESLHNVKQNKYQLLTLPDRAGVAKPPLIHLVDLRKQPLDGGLSPALLTKIAEHLQNRGQVLLFLNRRGFAPILMCHHCGEFMSCSRCDAKMVLHLKPQKLVCHHCGVIKSPPRTCQKCHQMELMPVGLGTERLAEILNQHFPEHRILRMDRDTIKNKKQLEHALDQINNQQVDILIGTQMLAKGHHFANLTLVAIVDADGGLFCADFRGLEKMAQMIVQVSGRAGREQILGDVVIQTHHPEHPLLKILLEQGYLAFAEEALKERKSAELPPFSHLALLRAQATNKEAPLQFLQNIKSAMQENIPHGVQFYGPVPALMERKAGNYRYQILVQSNQRVKLQQSLTALNQILLKNKFKKVKWMLDVDPQEIL